MLFGLTRRIAPLQILALLALLPVLGGASAAEVEVASKTPEQALSVAPPPVAAKPPKADKSVSKADAAVANAVKPDVALDGDQMRTRFIIGLGKNVQYQV